MTVRESRPRGLTLVIGLALLGALAIVLYWALFFSGAVSSDPEYVAFELAFPAADAWLTIAILLACVGLLRRKAWGVLFALMAGGAAIFLGLMDLLYDLEKGIFLIGGTEAAIEIVNIVLALGLGSVLSWYVWTRRQVLM